MASSLTHAEHAPEAVGPRPSASRSSVVAGPTAAAQVLGLQRAAGNRAATRFVRDRTTPRAVQRCPADPAGASCQHGDRDVEVAGAQLLREAVASRADQQLVQRLGWKDVPLIGKTVWCQMEMGHAFALRAECMKEYKEACSGDMLDPACTNFCRRPLIKRDERAWYERWFGLAPDPNRIVPMAEPGSSGNISDCIVDCMKSKDPDVMGTFLEVCSGNAASAMGD
jgi:hypothetical protein